MSFQQMFKSALCLSLFVPLSATAAPLKVSSHCNQFGEKTEHYKTCSAYPPDKVFALSAGADLNDAVDNHNDGELLIVRASTEEAPYRISRTLFLKNGMGMLSTGSGTTGFFHVTPADNFAPEDHPVYCLIDLATGSTITGLSINAGTFSEAAITTLEQFDGVKTLVHVDKSSGFTFTWSSLKGRPDLASNVFVEQSDSGTRVSGDSSYTIRRSWVESAGAQMGIQITAGKGEDTGRVELKHLVVKVSDESEHGLYLVSAKGEIEHNYFTMDHSTREGNKNRHLLTMHNLYDPDTAQMPTIAENYFHSSKSSQAPEDIALQFLQTGSTKLEAHVFANAYTGNLTPSQADANTPNTGSQVLLQENYQQEAADLVPDWDQFFDDTNAKTTWPRGGICFASLFATESLNRTQTAVGSDNAWPNLCGSGLTRDAFKLANEYTGPTGPECSDSSNNCSGWKAGLGVSVAINVILAAVTAGLVYRIRTSNNSQRFD